MMEVAVLLQQHVQSMETSLRHVSNDGRLPDVSFCQRG